MNEKNCHILLIEHEFAVRYLLQTQLKENGHEVFAAKDVNAGLMLLRSEKVDLVALNLSIPNSDGFGLFKQMKSDPSLASIPVVFIADQGDQNDRSIAFELGADDFIIKPFLADEFLARITAVLKKRITKPSQYSTKSRILTLFSPKGGVGTTTLAIQLAKAVSIQYEQETVLLDLNLPLGGIAQKLNLQTSANIVDFLKLQKEHFEKQNADRFIQKHHTNLFVVPAPGQFQAAPLAPDPNALIYLFDYLMKQKITVIVDAGSQINRLTLAAMRRSDTIFTVTTGRLDANQMVNAFLNQTNSLRIDKKRVLPVVNEIYGHHDESDLVHLPVARIPTVDHHTQTRLWLQSPGIKKLVSFAC
ncbi:MAG: response regulator [Chloroflexota bacterium]